VREVVEQRPGLREFLGHVVDARGIGEQQAVAFEERARTGLPDRAEALGLLAQGIGQFIGGRIGKLLGRGLHHGEDHLVALRKGVADGLVVLRPGGVGFKQPADIGVDGEVAGRVDACGNGQQQGNANYQPGVGGSEFDGANEQRSDHVFEIFIARLRRGAWAAPGV
jgi:hypothetical protein